ncbi:MAG: hypothetical protein JWN43_2529 [Gammaproteobacteria bacterium]|nr:hypothetical protein [Gammaproteobacteria bacterium]
MVSGNAAATAAIVAHALDSRVRLVPPAPFPATYGRRQLTDWHQACRRFNSIQKLAEHPGRLGRRVKAIARMFGATDRTVRRWLSVYRRNPDIIALLPRQKGQRIGKRRLKPGSERLLGEVIETEGPRPRPLDRAALRREVRSGDDTHGLTFSC